MFLAAADLPVTAVTVRTLAGAGSTGQVFADPVDAGGYLSEKRTLIRDKNGVEVISEVSLFTDPDKGDPFTPGSEVDLPGPRTVEVIAVSRNVIGRPEVDHCRIWLT